MRGGPISTRRVVLEDPSLQEVIDYVEANGEDMWNDLPTSDSTQVTVLLFRDGDQLNFFRVIDRGDGTLTPLSESLSGNSMYNLYDEDEDSSLEERSSENAVMKDKVRNLKAKMRVINASKKMNESNRDHQLKPSPPPRPPMAPLPPHRTPRPPSDLNTPRNLSNGGTVRRRMYSKIEEPRQEEALPPLSGRGSRQLPKIKSRSEASKTFENAIDNSQPLISRVCSAKVALNEIKSSVVSDKSPSSVPVSAKGSCTSKESLGHYKRYTQQKKETASDPLAYLKPSGAGEGEKSREVSARLSSRISGKVSSSESLGKITKHVTYDINTRTNHVLTREKDNDGRKSVIHRLNSSERKNLRALQVLSRQGSITPPASPGTRLPPVNVPPPPKPKKKNVTRCNFCRKKTGLATTYTCHCEGTFCAIHRYAEAHQCPYDYKSTGRKLLEAANPVVTAPKLPKI